jgi:hypothetical protein
MVAGTVRINLAYFYNFCIVTLWSGRIFESIFGSVSICGPMLLPRRTDCGKSRLGLVSPDASRLEEEHRLFVQLAFTTPAVFFVQGEERSERNEHV